MSRKSYSPEFKFQIVLEALKERETLQEIASKNSIAPSQITRWVDEFKSSGSNVFQHTNRDAKKLELLEKEQTRLYSVVGEQTMKIDWLKKKLDQLEGK